MPETHKAILEKANAAIAAGDIDGFLAHCADDIVWQTVGGDTLRGKEAVRRQLKTDDAQPPRFTLEQTISEGDYLAALGQITLPGKDGMEAPHTYCDVWRFRDGKMVELRAFVIEAARPGDA
jgi:ketosteroid isomerase-like protein